MNANYTKEAVFLQGPLIAALAGGPLYRSGGVSLAPALNLAAKGSSETTLTCWEDCTIHISGC